MSLVPLLMNLMDDPLEELLTPPNLRSIGCDRHHHPHSPAYFHQNCLCPGGYYRHPLMSHRYGQAKRSKGNLAQSAIGKDGFQVCLDVEHFQPNEITVKTVDNAIVVEGKHEEKEDAHGQVYRHFVRRYALPKEFDVGDVISTLSSDGVLTIKAPPLSKLQNKERVIPIQQTGPAHLSIKENQKEDKKSEEKMAE